MQHCQQPLKKNNLCKTLAVHQQLVMVALKMEQNTDQRPSNCCCSAVVALLYQPLAIARHSSVPFGDANANRGYEGI